MGLESQTYIFGGYLARRRGGNPGRLALAGQCGGAPNLGGAWEREGWHSLPSLARFKEASGLLPGSHAPAYPGPVALEEGTLALAGPPGRPPTGLFFITTTLSRSFGTWRDPRSGRSSDSCPGAGDETLIQL